MVESSPWLQRQRHLQPHGPPGCPLRRWSWQPSLFFILLYVLCSFSATPICVSFFPVIPCSPTLNLMKARIIAGFVHCCAFGIQPPTSHQSANRMQDQIIQR